jgi:hypothetical protein
MNNYFFLFGFGELARFPSQPLGFLVTRISQVSTAEVGPLKREVSKSSMARLT